MEKQGNFVDGSRRKGSSEGYSSGSYKGYFDTDEEYDDDNQEDESDLLTKSKELSTENFILQKELLNQSEN